MYAYIYIGVHTSACMYIYIHTHSHMILDTLNMRSYEYIGTQLTNIHSHIFTYA